MIAFRHISALAFVGALAVANVRAGEPPQRAEPLPPELEKVGIDEQLGETIPLDLEFVDEHGKSVRLRDYFTTGRPVVLNLGYYRCPMLCGLVLNGLVDAVAETELAVGERLRHRHRQCRSQRDAPLGLSQEKKRAPGDRPARCREGLAFSDRRA
jgi:cytochrome oxidase Cu insertion factor (SCO1/SenC/PrrC family)